MTSRFLAFDLGAGSGRALLGELENEKLSLREIHRFENNIIKNELGFFWDIEALYAEILRGIEICVKNKLKIKSIGIDTWGVDFGLLDENGKLLENPHSYRDPRTDGTMEKLFNRIPRSRIYELTGIQFLQINTINQLLSLTLSKSPTLEKARHLLFIPDILNYRLTGRKTTEFTFATTSQLFNPVEMKWERELFDAIDFPAEMMQEVIKPGKVIGKTTEEIEKLTGLPQTPVIAPATHDTGSAVAAAPLVGSSSAFISSGTWSIMGVETTQVDSSPEALEKNFTNEGGIGGTFRFSKNIAGLWLLQQCAAKWFPGGADYGKLASQALSAGPFSAVINPDDPRFLNPENMPEEISAFCRETGQEPPFKIPEFCRIIFESLALRYREVASEIQETRGLKIDSINIVGGGSENKTLCQFTADATGLNIFAGPKEATAIGNLLAQALGTGCLESINIIREVVRNSFEIKKYEPADTSTWNEPFEKFQALKS